MKKRSLRWKLLVPLAVVATGLSVLASSSLASSKAGVVRVAIMTDCKGAFGFGYEPDIGGAQAAFATWAGGKPVNPKKPSAGIISPASSSFMPSRSIARFAALRTRMSFHGEPGARDRCQVQLCG